MENHYHHLSTTDRVTLMLMIRQRASLRAVASELKRHAVDDQPYDAEATGCSARSARVRCWPKRKLVEGTDLYDVVLDMLRNRWSPPASQRHCASRSARHQVSH